MPFLSCASLLRNILDSPLALYNDSSLSLDGKFEQFLVTFLPENTCSDRYERYVKQEPCKNKNNTRRGLVISCWLFKKYAGISTNLQHYFHVWFLPWKRLWNHCIPRESAFETLFHFRPLHVLGKLGWSDLYYGQLGDLVVGVRVWQQLLMYGRFPRWMLRDFIEKKKEDLLPAINFLQDARTE